jgi:CMP-N,N'-diacetyllegionaminic acid synthase
MTSVNTVAIIPARGGSRGLAGKHLLRLGGIPVIVHTIRAALTARRIDRVLVSTDDPKIGRIAKRAGAEVPFLRPRELAMDTSPTYPVILHAVEWLEGSGSPIDLVVTLQPTSPLRDAREIDACVALLDDPRVRSALTVTSLGLPASIVGAVDGGRFRPLVPPGGDMRRQVSPLAVRVTGGVYVTRRDLLAEGMLLDDSPAIWQVSGGSAIDIDDATDLAAARRALRSRSEPAG